MRGRNADLFTFSKTHIGSDLTGYCSTVDMETLDPQIDLATVMAISGAAVAPNQGMITNRALRYLMAVANARLGYWLINPGKIDRIGAVRKRVSSYYFFLELFGAINEKRLRAYISDGGHFDNTGVYSLLKRRCECIIAIDGQSDPELHFAGLSNLIRLARIDMGIIIDINLIELRRTRSGFSREHAAVGTIYYPVGPGDLYETGKLIYMKASLTGNESEYLYEYRSRNPAFPHEATLDQFFTEAQFEAYRELGHHVGTGLFSGANEFQSLASWIKELEDRFHHLYFDQTNYLRVQEMIGNLEQTLYGNDDEHKRYIEARRKVNLIEYAVLTLRLREPVPAQNYGEIIGIFATWVRAAEFEECWPVIRERVSATVRDFIDQLSAGSKTSRQPGQESTDLAA